jgi:putative hydrolase of the HAD superfamily
MALTTMFLDAGGVLANPNWERVATVLAHHGVAVEAAALARAEPHAKRTLDTADAIRTSTDLSRAGRYWELVLARAGVTAPAEPLAAAWAELRDYHARLNLWESVIAGVPEALTRLRARGLRLVVVSNANGTLRQKLVRVGLADRLDIILDSHELGVEKPDPRIFEIALERAGITPDQALHVGDLYQVDVVGARAAGVAAVLVDPLDLYTDHDCRRVPSLLALAEALG